MLLIFTLLFFFGQFIKTENLFLGKKASLVFPGIMIKSNSNFKKIEEAKDLKKEEKQEVENFIQLKKTNNYEKYLFSIALLNNYSEILDFLKNLPKSIKDSDNWRVLLICRLIDTFFSPDYTLIGKEVNPDLFPNTVIFFEQIKKKYPKYFKDFKLNVSSHNELNLDFFGILYDDLKEFFDTLFRKKIIIYNKTLFLLESGDYNNPFYEFFLLDKILAKNRLFYILSLIIITLLFVFIVTKILFSYNNIFNIFMLILASGIFYESFQVINKLVIKSNVWDVCITPEVFYYAPQYQGFFGKYFTQEDVSEAFKKRFGFAMSEKSIKKAEDIINQKLVFLEILNFFITSCNNGELKEFFNFFQNFSSFSAEEVNEIVKYSEKYKNTYPNQEIN